MPTLKKAAETPAAAPAALSPPVSPASVPIRPPQPTAPKPSRKSAAPQQPLVAGLQQRERDAREAGEHAHGEQRRAPCAGAAARRPAGSAAADGPGGLGERQQARGGGDAVAPGRAEEQHELGQRGELDRAEEGREPVVQISRERSAAANQLSARWSPRRRVTPATPSSSDGHPRRLAEVPLAGRRVAVQRDRDAADDEGEGGGEDEAGLSSVATATAWSPPRSCR